jgi:hypothetical protein
MDNLKDNIKIVDGDKKTLMAAKFRIHKQRLSAIVSNTKWKLFLLLNGFRF